MLSLHAMEKELPPLISVLLLEPLLVNTHRSTTDMVTHH